MTVADMKIAIQQFKKELWKGIPMSKESEKKYKQYIKMCENTSVSNIPRGGGRMDERFGLSAEGISLRDIRAELEKYAERDRDSGKKCGLLCQIKKRKS